MRQTIHIVDTQAEQAYADREPLRVATAELGGARSLLNVPMLKEGELIGAIGIYRQEVRPFTDKQVELVTNFAAQAVIAIENTRLLNELRELLQQQTATADVLRVISSSPGDLTPVFQIMLENAVRICDARFGVMFLYEGNAFRVVAQHNAPPAYAEGWQREPVLAIRDHPGAPLARLARTTEIVHVADLKEEPAYLERDRRIVALVEFAGARSFVTVPMLKENVLIGAIAIYRQEVRPFTDKADRAGHELRRAGSHRHREHAVAQRAAAIAAAADRHRRRAQGHQPLDLRPAGRARYAGRIGGPALRGGYGEHLATERVRAYHLAASYGVAREFEE